MSMTREEAISRIQDHMERHRIGKYPHIRLAEAFLLALTALRPVSREQVEKVWRGEWREEIVNKCDWKGKKREYYQPHSCSKCHRADPGEGKSKFCSHCGAPMTDEAMQMVMERLEALKDD